MLNKEDHESHESLSDLRQIRDIFLSPTSNATETKSAQPSRKRKLTDIEHGKDIGEAFTIKV